MYAARISIAFLDALLSSVSRFLFLQIQCNCRLFGAYLCFHLPLPLQGTDSRSLDGLQDSINLRSLEWKKQSILDTDYIDHQKNPCQESRL